MKLTNYITRLANMTDEEYERCCRMARAVFLSKDRSLNIDYLMDSMFDLASADTSSIEVERVLDELIAMYRIDRVHTQFVRLHSQLFLQNVRETDSFRHVYRCLSYLPSVSLNVRLFDRDNEFLRLFATDFMLETARKSRRIYEHRILPYIIKPEYLVNDASVTVDDLFSNYRLLLKEIVQFAELTGGEINYD